MKEFLLYNETLELLDLSKNEISKISKPFLDLVRNRSSNLLSISLEENKIEIDEFLEMIKIIETESPFGKLHFKLRILNLVSNPMKDFDMKI